MNRFVEAVEIHYLWDELRGLQAAYKPYISDYAIFIPYTHIGRNAGRNCPRR